MIVIEIIGIEIVVGIIRSSIGFVISGIEMNGIQIGMLGI